MNRTFYVHEHRQGRLMHQAVESALGFLTGAEMLIEIGDNLGATEFGSLVSRLYIDPRSAAMVVGTLKDSVAYSDRGLLQVLCSTPDMPRLYVRNTDIDALSRMIEEHTGELWLPFPSDDEQVEQYYRALKTAMLLSDWTDEMSEEKICERYSVGPGDVYGMVESVNWLLHASSQLARMFALSFYPRMRELEICMKNGIRRELLPLVRLRGIGRVRARRLFNNGITVPEEIVRHPKDEIVRILGQGITDQIFDQLQHRNAMPDEPANETDGDVAQSTLLRFG
jgi:helicase